MIDGDVQNGWVPYKTLNNYRYYLVVTGGEWVGPALKVHLSLTHRWVLPLTTDPALPGNISKFYDVYKNLTLKIESI